MDTKTTAENDFHRFPPWWIENQATCTLEMTAASRHGGLSQAVVVDLRAASNAAPYTLEHAERQALEDIREAAAATPATLRPRCRREGRNFKPRQPP